MTDTIDHLGSLLADRYDIRRELGRGGMSVVYLAQDLKQRRAVALKILHPDLTKGIGAVRFNREIEIVSQFTHPYILPIFTSGAVEDFLYYVMPYVEDESLRQRLDREQQLPVEDAVAVARDVADGLIYAHSHGVVHRDIKPGNILLVGGHGVITDFGIARALVKSGGDRLTETGFVVGTPSYMSPEQGSGQSEPDARTDVYALGCVLYEMLAGKPPLTGATPQATLIRRMTEDPPPLRHVRDTISIRLEEVISRALARVPADRFQSAAEFKEALADTETVRVPGAPAAPETHDRSQAGRTTRGRRQRVTVGAAAGAAVLAATLLIVAVRSGTSPGGESDFARPPGPAPAPNRIAVLYFDDLSPDQSLAHLSNGLTEALIDELSGAPALEVISPNGVRPFRGPDVRADSVGSSLQVGTLVQGSVAQSGDLLRVNVRLINAMTNEQLASASFSQPRGELFALQDTLTHEVGNQLRLQLGEEVRLRELRSGARNVDAWELVQRAERTARDAEPLIAGGDLQAGEIAYARADSLLARAASLDGGWAQPPLLRAQLAYQQSRWTATQDRERTGGLVERAAVFVERALSIDTENADALEVRGTIRYWSWLLNLYPGRADALFDEAESDLRAAVARNPLQAGAWATLSHLVTNKPGSTSEAQVTARRAYQADAYLANANVVLARLFFASYDLNDHREAERWCDEGYGRFPDDFRFTECRLWVLTMAPADPDLDRAWELWREFDRLIPPQQIVYRGRGRMAVSAVAARAGVVDSAAAIAESARLGPDVDPTRDLSYLEAFTRTLLAQPREATRLLSDYMAANPEDGGEAIDHWWFDALREDPTFQTLLAPG